MEILTASFILPISREPIRDGAVVTHEGTIVDVGPDKKIRKKYPDATLKEFGNAVLMPGLVNTDTHMEFLSYEGTGREPHFIDWFLARLDHQQRLTPEAQRNNLKDGIERLVRAGTTCIGDVGNYGGMIPQLAMAPLRMILFPEILTSAEAHVTDRYQAALGIVDEIRRRNLPRISAGLAPYAPYTLSRHLLKIIATHARETKIPVKIHAASSFAEMQFFYESKGEIAETLFPKLGWIDSLPPPHRKTPIEFLESIGFLENKPILVGCLHLADKDLKILSRSGSKVVWRPRAQKYLKLGETPVSKLKKAKVPIGLGTDGVGSRQSLSLWDEMREAEKTCPPEEVLEIATLGGAAVLGMEKEIGSLEKGKKADMIAIKIPSSLRANHLASHLVQKTSEREILATFIDGKKVQV